MRDEQLMDIALAHAARAIGNTSPNPMVGAVVAPTGGDPVPIATGHHERAGGPHAEAVALERAGAAARGATLYVTLEPCAHHGRTPPCTDAILRAGIERVVVATLDEGPRAGGGAEQLRAAGVRVDVGVREPQARHLNKMYFHQRRTSRPFVTLKMAQSADAAVATRAGERYRLTGSVAAEHVRQLRYEHDAVMIGVGTAIVDNPHLTVRPYKKRAMPYVRVIVDAAARLPLASPLVAEQAQATTIVATTARAPAERTGALRAAGVEVLELPQAADGRIDLHALLERLGTRGMLGVLCEGGPTLATALLDADLVGELHLLVAPVLLGSAERAPTFHRLATPRSFQIETVDALGEDVLIVMRR